mmetsp:Transcript_16363/g.40321  ORF Transcript_16363/g.40321 Transcript_16363/m.40321 type:complete len:342 (+) Transcript_16363:109-1134(+)
MQGSLKSRKVNNFPQDGQLEASYRKKFSPLELRQTLDVVGRAGIPTERIREIRELEELLQSKDKLAVFDGYRPQHLAALLEFHRPTTLTKHLLVADKEWNKHRVCPSELHADVRRMIQSGAGMVRGFDNCRRPIFWLRQKALGKNYRHRGPAFCAFLIWMHLVAIRKRSSDVQFISLVIDEKDHKLLDASIESVILSTEATRKMFLPCGIVGKVYLVSPSVTARTTLGLVQKMFPGSLARMAVVKERAKIFDIVENPADVPDYFGERGSPVDISSSTVGDYEREYFQSGVLKFTDIFRADEIEDGQPPSSNRSIGVGSDCEESESGEESPSDFGHGGETLL